MFSNGPNLQQQNNEKNFMINDTQVPSKRKSISFCMNEETMKDASFFQNYFNSDISLKKQTENSKGNANKL
jgi:hypothetical protein